MQRHLVRGDVQANGYRTAYGFSRATILVAFGALYGGAHLIAQSSRVQTAQSTLQWTAPRATPSLLEPSFRSASFTDAEGAMIAQTGLQQPAPTQQPEPPPPAPANSNQPAQDKQTQDKQGQAKQGQDKQTLPDEPGPRAPIQIDKQDCKMLPCPVRAINWYLRFENGPQVKPLTPMEKGWLATKNVIDPFNVITILGTDGISIAADSHSAYGPGWPGWARNVGVSFTEDITGEFFGTFLIPSLVHQDPHYHRMPQASYKRRILHCFDQIVWTQGDNGKGMLNYADLVGLGIDDEIANLYVPGRQTNGSATAQRYGISLATAPIDNFISEFLPDVARRIHIQVVVVQRIIDQVANKDSGGAGGGN